MAANTWLMYPLCVEWITELPYENASRKIDIPFRDSEWFLKLICDGEKEEYRLTLCSKEKENVASYKRPIMVTTYVQDTSNDSEPTLIDISKRKVDKEDNVLWRKIRDDISKSNPKLLYIGKFTIICVFHSISNFPKQTSSQVSTQPPLLSSSKYPTVTDDLQMLSHDFVALLKDETLPDVQLKCEGRSFSAHRCVLAARSEVFAAMFRNKMAEKHTGVVDIQGLNPEVLEMLLQYMYSGMKPNLSEDTAPGLYEAAVKYAVRALQKACSDWMLRNMTLQNCVDVLKLADRHFDNSLRTAVASFIAQHTTVLRPERWLTFKKKLSKCAVEILEKLPGFPQHGQNDAQPSQNQSASLLTSTQCTLPQQLSASTPIHCQHLPTQNKPIQQGPNFSVDPRYWSPRTDQSPPVLPLVLPPKNKFSVQPAQNYPAKSAPNIPLQLGSNYSLQPDQNVPVRPAQNNPVQFGPNYSLQPGQNFPVQPAQNNPVQLDSNYSLQPGQNFPVQPDSNYPAQPGQNYPVQPGSNYPVQPGPNYSVQPGQNVLVQPPQNYPAEPAQNIPRQFGKNYVPYMYDFSCYQGFKP